MNTPVSPGAFGSTPWLRRRPFRKVRRSLLPGFRRPATRSSTRARSVPAFEASVRPSTLMRGCFVKEVPYNRRFTMESRSPC